MSVTDINRDKLSLYPAFSSILEEFELKLRENSLPFYLFEGFRSFDRQRWLYTGGRTRQGTIVTNTMPGKSWHNYGFAADYVLDGMISKPGIQWSWDIRGNPKWLKMAQLAIGFGLESGYFWENFPDCPHIQFRAPLAITEAFRLHQIGGLPAVWSEADKLILNRA